MPISKLQTRGALFAAVVVLGGCTNSFTQAYSQGDPNVDRGIDAHKLSDMRASLWVDPLGCEHWFIDDGVEGYLTNRLNRDGTPRCGPAPGEPGERPN